MKIEVNNTLIEANPGETILQAMKRAHIEVPTLCWLKDMTPTGACRMCVVELEGCDHLVTSCSFPVSEGMKIKTHSQKAIQARKTIIELLLSSHPNDCLYCARVATCQLSKLAREYGVNRKLWPGQPKGHPKDNSSLSILREPDKCILCSKCVRVCEEVQGVGALDFIHRGSRATVGCAFGDGLNVSSCINCGQCVNVCPTGALSEKTHMQKVMDAIADPDLHVVVQHAPAISVTLAQTYHLPTQNPSGVLTAILRKMGFDTVFDTSFSADLTIMEEGSELVHRIKNNGVLPMFTSCSPGWIKFIEQFYHDFVPNLSSCKSPQEMLGAITKSYYAQKKGIDPKKIFSVSVMPCTAKKFEAARPELSVNGLQDLDAVLTTRELIDLIDLFGINPAGLEPEPADLPFGEHSSAGKLFGGSGGVMEAALRSAHYLLTGKNMNNPEITKVRGLEGIKKTKLKIGELELGVAVVSGLGNARTLMEEIRQGLHPDLHFVEVMSCPGGCINGGGQPRDTDPQAIKKRLQALYKVDASTTVRCSHENESILSLYRDFLKEPLSELSHKLLHTHYHPREENI